MRTARTSLRGFTLVELLVVMAIMAVLIGISIAGLGYAMRRSRNIARQAAAANLDRAIESYYSDNQTYPTAGDVVPPTTIGVLVDDILEPYLEGSWDVPPRTCVAYLSPDGERYVAGASQEVAGGTQDMYWTGPGLSAGAGWPEDDVTEDMSFDTGNEIIMNAWNAEGAWDANCASYTF
jgi:type IV pilus assembly protein PilA